MPSKLIELKGGVKHTHRPPRKNEPKPPSAIPKCPKHLDKEAKKEWRRMAKELEPLGLLTNLDKAVFALYCQAYSTWAQASREIQEKGMIFKSKNGYPLVNPYYQIANKAIDQMKSALIEMGMTPSSRSRVTVPEKKPKEKPKAERFFK